MNNGTIKIVEALEDLKFRTRKLNLPDIKYIMVGINVIKDIVKEYDPEEIDNDTITSIIEDINNDINSNGVDDINFSITIGLNLGLDAMRKLIVKNNKR